jgi:beta-N-acetylhexosaminidase
LTANLHHAAGSLLVVGLAGAELTGLERAWLKLVRPAGIILFRRNIVDAKQTRLLLHEATELCAEHSLRCVDVEGGTVDRLRDALSPIPSAQAVARATHPRSQNRDLGHPAGWAREHGALVARAVKAFGFNTTLAPVLDLGLSASVRVMGTRVAAATAEGVTQYGRGFLAGLAAHGVAGCGKHFPGLGGGTLDSHMETPSIGRTLRELNVEDLAPYGALREELPMVMVNHAAYPNTPGGIRPASVSPYWITTILRKRIGYRGIIFSDDLEMGGILQFMPIEEAVIGAVRAGMDLMEICHSPELILRAYESMIREAERSKTFRDLLLMRARETERKRGRLFAGDASRALTARQFEALRARILRFGDAVAKAQPTTEAQS